jgi:hypothetical protein
VGRSPTSCGSSKASRRTGPGPATSSLPGCALENAASAYLRVEQEVARLFGGELPGNELPLEVEAASNHDNGSTGGYEGSEEPLGDN